MIYSEDVVIQLLKLSQNAFQYYCMPLKFVICQRDLQSLDFTANRFFMKLVSTKGTCMSVPPW